MIIESLAVICDEKSSGSGGGTFTSGARRTRDLNTELYDPDGIVSISANQFTLQAGTYVIDWHATARDCGGHVSYLRNVTDGTDVARGMGTDNLTGLVHPSKGTAYLSISAAKTFEIQHECTTTGTYGSGGGWGVEHYTAVAIRKLTASGTNSHAVLCHDEASGTNGGGVTAGSWATRTIDTEDSDPDSIVTLAANQFTLQAGNYEFWGTAELYACNESQLKIYNVTDAADVVIGVNADAQQTDGCNNAWLYGGVTIASAKTFEVQHRVNRTVATIGAGVAASMGTVEKYLKLHIRKF